MPEPMVREDIEGGRLVPLDMPELKRGSLRLYAIYRTDTPPGPAGSWLISRFEAQAATEPVDQPTVRPAAHDR
jgi:DNA-binding transcriptional LysR family regulator